MRKTVSILISVAVLCGLLLLANAFVRKSGSGLDSDSLRPTGRKLDIVLSDIRRGQISDLRLFPGTIMPRPQNMISALVPGRIKSIEINLGQAVEADDLVARINDDSLRQDMEMADSSLTVAKLSVELQQLSLDLARKKRERVKELWEQNVASEMAWDDANANYTIQLAQHKMALARMSEAEQKLNWCRKKLLDTSVRIPPDIGAGSWFVSEIKVEEGAMVAANMPMACVVDLSRVSAAIHVSERDYPFLEIGQDVVVSADALPDMIFSGKISSIEPAFQSGVRPALRDEEKQAKIEIEIPNDKFRLRPGMSITANIEFARNDSANLIPREALTAREGRPGVFVFNAESGVVNFIPVNPEIRTDSMISITEEDLAGRVICRGHDKLQDGELIADADFHEYSFSQ